MVSLVTILAVSAYAIFELPYHYPLRYPTNSVSYVMGFNNQVAVLACVATVVLLSLWILRTQLEVGKAGALFQTSGQVDPWTPMDKTAFWTLVAVFAFLTILLYLATPFLGTYGEARYFFRRFELILQYNLIPYRQIEFAYGPALVYLPIAMFRICQWAGLPYELAYLLFYLFLSLFGLWLLFYVVNHFRCKAEYRVLVFVLLGMAFFNICFGLQYTATRYILPFAALLWLHNAASRGSGLLAGPLKAALVGFLLPAAVLSISPEIGIVYLAAQTLFFLIASVQSKRFLAWGALTGVLVLPVFLAVFSMDYLSCVGAFSKGGNNFPLVPAAHIVFFLITLFYALPVLLVSLLSKDGRGALPIMAGWGVLILLMLPSTLGRCDPGHVFFSGIGVILLAFALLAKYHPRGLTVYAILFLLMAILLRHISDVFLYREQLWQVEYTLSDRLYTSRTAELPPSPLAKIRDYGPFMTPLVLDFFTERYVRAEKCIIPEYYPDLINVFDPSTVARKIRDLEKANAVLVPEWVLHFQNVDYLDPKTKLPPEVIESQENRERGSLSILFLYPVHYEMKNRWYSAYWAVARYLATHFRPVRTEHEEIKDKKEEEGARGKYIFMVRIRSQDYATTQATSKP